jgi:hypothetical protein
MKEKHIKINPDSIISEISAMRNILDNELLKWNTTSKSYPKIYNHKSLFYKILLDPKTQLKDYYGMSVFIHGTY